MYYPFYQLVRSLQPKNEKTMSTPREIFSALVDACEDIDNLLAGGLAQDELQAMRRLRRAVDAARDELNSRHEIVLFISSGKVGHIFSNVDIGANCTIVNFDGVLSAEDDCDVGEIYWTASGSSTGKVRILPIGIATEPVLVGDVISAREQKHVQWLTELRNGCPPLKLD